MNFWHCLYQVLIGPLKLLFEFIFVQAYYFVGNPGIAIVFLSLAMNFLVLPLYNRADKMQESVREQEKRLEPWVSHIRKTFSGDERIMILSVYYRQQQYKPIYALKGSLSLLLEIPFFLGAYSFLSELELLKGVSLGMITDLSKPDGLFSVFGVPVNVLPIVMTVINFISSAVYLHGFPLKNKIQTYATAVVFLLLLYRSPSGLVFYWTLNNLFSLFKNVFSKFRDLLVVLKIALSMIGVYWLFFIIFVHPLENFGNQCLGIVMSFLFHVPLVFPLLKKRFHLTIKFPGIPPATKVNGKIFVIGCLFLTILTGILIPTAVIGDSVTEFINDDNTSPLWFVVSALLYASGTFLLWFNVFYRLATPTAKTVFSYGIWIMTGLATVNYLFFGTDYGMISPTLVYDEAPVNTIKDLLWNSAVVLLVGTVFFVLMKKKALLVRTVCWILCITVCSMSAINVKGIVQENRNHQQIGNQDSQPIIRLSTQGKNVVILMLDRAVGHLFPYLLHEKPELKQKLSGFTYYPNTISFATSTNMALPAVFGGYEYTPEAINKRNQVPLAEKHDEALRLLPSLFSAEGYQVAVGNPSYAGYQEDMDLSIFDDIPNVTAYTTKGKISTGLAVVEKMVDEATTYSQFRNFFCYGLYRTSPLLLQPYLYKDGRYNSVRFVDEAISSQNMDGLNKSTGMTKSYLNNFSVMSHLEQITKISNDKKNNFTMLCNELTHAPILLQLPDYTPSLKVDNTAYGTASLQKQTDEGERLSLSTVEQVTTYHVNMEAFLLLGDWFDYLREQHVYDNTRIILVSDHGYNLNFSNYQYGTEEWKDISMYSPILLVKDFADDGYRQDKQFMTNADVPTLALADIVDNPVNPVTGNVVNNQTKFERSKFTVYLTYAWKISLNNGNTFNFHKMSEVKKSNDNVLSSECWQAVQ